MLAAAAQGDLQLVALLLKQGAAIEALARGTRSPLMLASFSAHLQVVRQLLDAGANVNAANKLAQTVSLQ